MSSFNSADNSSLSILAYLKQQYDFVGSYYINIGDNSNTANNNLTNWSDSLPYYKQLLQLGNEIGDHSYTHLVNPPAVTVGAATGAAASAGATTITLKTLPAYNGATIGMIVSDPSNPAAIGANTIVTNVSGNATTGYTLTLLYEPGGYGTPNNGVVAAIPSGTTLNFTVPTENTNFLSTATTGNFTYNYEFGTSKTVEASNIGIAIAGAAVPGANDYLPDSQQILSYFPSASGLTGYVSGGWTGVGSGSPNAFGYITPGNTSSVYIAPNITFDFSEIQYENKSPASSLADWESLFNQLSANSATPIIVWPWHDYGITNWPTNGIGTPAPGYTEALYQSFIQYAYNAGDEFVTTEDLARRIAAEQAATLSETTAGSVITASVTPGASQLDLGAMALNVVNGAAGQVIQNAGNWYAYDTNSVFLANDTAGKGAAETFAVTLGTTQDDVTHVASLPMRADLQSVTGNGSNMTFSFTGDGRVGIHIKTPTAGAGVVSVQQSITGTAGAGALSPTATLAGDDLELTFNDGAAGISTTSPQGVPLLHTVTITEGATAVAGATFVFGSPTVAITSAGGFTNQKTQTINGTVTEPTASQVVGTTVSLYDNGSTTALGTATVKAGVAGVAGGLPTWTATVTLTGDGTHSIVASDKDVSGLTGSSSAVVYTLDTVAPMVTASESVSGVTNKTSDTFTVTAAAEAVGGDAISGVKLYNGTTLLGSATLASGTTASGTWTYIASGLVNGTYAFNAVTTDLAGNSTTSTLAPVTVNTTAPTVAITGSGGAVSTASQTITGTVTESTQSNVVGSKVTLYDNGSTTPLATAVVQAGTGGGLPTWSAPVTLAVGANSIVATDVDLAGNTGSSIPVVYTLSTSTTPPQTITQGTGSQTVVATGPTTVNAAAAPAGATLTLSGAGAVTVTNVAENINATGLSGALAVTTQYQGLSIATGSGPTTVNAAAMTGALTLSGAGAVTVTGLRGNLTATSETGAVTVTTTGANQLISAGSGNLSIIDTSTGTVSVNAASMASGALLSLSGPGAATVSNLRGSINASGSSGKLTISETDGGTIQTGTGVDTVTARRGGNTIAVNGAGDTFNVAGHTAADSFVYASTSASQATITGFATGGSIHDLLNMSAINPTLAIEGSLSSGTTAVAADSIAWLYSGGNAMVYVNNTNSALSTGSSSLLEVTLAGVSSGLSSANFA